MGSGGARPGPLLSSEVPPRFIVARLDEMVVGGSKGDRGPNDLPLCPLPRYDAPLVGEFLDNL